MCGIFGYVGPQDATQMVLGGLSRLAYRGYDSAGIAIVGDEGRLTIRKANGKLENLLTLVGEQPLAGRLGVGHTRWATHGPPSDANAHPHLDGSGRIAVVHNGIVENFAQLRDRLVANGHEFSSATDTEVIPHLIQELLESGISLEEAVRLAASQLKGAHAIACVHVNTPDTMVAVRIGNAGGISVGVGDGEMFVASDLPAVVPLTSTVTFLEPGELAVIHPGNYDLLNLEGENVTTTRHTIGMSPVAAAKAGHKHFMLKEIKEQPEAVMNALRGRLDFSPERISLSELTFTTQEIQRLSRVIFVGMGTSVYASQIGCRFIEHFARIPATAENAAEFRYRDPVIDENTLVVAVTQSGETADTLEALHEAQARGARTATITNVEGSQAARSAEVSLLMRAGPEIGVASTKTMLNSMVVMYLLACALGQQRGLLPNESMAERVGEVSRLPSLLGEALDLA